MNLINKIMNLILYYPAICTLVAVTLVGIVIYSNQITPAYSFDVKINNFIQQWVLAIISMAFYLTTLGALIQIYRKSDNYTVIIAKMDTVFFHAFQLYDLNVSHQITIITIILTIYVISSGWKLIDDLLSHEIWKLYFNLLMLSIFLPILFFALGEDVNEMNIVRRQKID